MASDPERFAQEALGHNSKAVHRALMKIPSLEKYELEAINESCTNNVKNSAG
jgi:hypothetical protein